MFEVFVNFTVRLGPFNLLGYAHRYCQKQPIIITSEIYRFTPGKDAALDIETRGLFVSFRCVDGLHSPTPIWLSKHLTSEYGHIEKLKSTYGLKFEVLMDGIICQSTDADVSTTWLMRGIYT